MKHPGAKPIYGFVMVQVAIEQLQQELSASRKEEEVFKDEARKVQLSALPCLCIA